MTAKHDAKIQKIREAAEADLKYFIALIAPHRVLGHVHGDLISWWTREDAKDHQLALMPRDHQKSAMIAYRVAWELTRRPWLTFLYMSATASLAQKQLSMIKTILTSRNYRRYWPEMVHTQKAKRELWNADEIAVDHPLRKKEQVRDASISTCGLTKNITGLHFNVAVLDDVVVKENAYNATQRDQVKSAYSLLASIETTGSQEWAVGTRYHHNDLYNDLIGMEEDTYNEDGEYLGSVPVYEVFEKVLEDSPGRDGTGQYLWPKQKRHDGRIFGFDISERARKKAKYLDQSQFYAQYYNDPTDPFGSNITADTFAYYDQSKVYIKNGKWFYGNIPLNVYAAVDFAYSLSRAADFCAIVTIGIDSEKNIYVLDIDRFKTVKPSVMFDHVANSYVKWGWIKIAAETTAAQKAIVEQIKDLRAENGFVFRIEEHNPNRYTGSKEERMMAALEPRYADGKIWHYKGGNCQMLEDELTSAKPEHDDIKDALTAAIDLAKPPSDKMANRFKRQQHIQFNSRFGGIAH